MLYELRGKMDHAVKMRNMSSTVIIIIIVINTHFIAPNTQRLLGVLQIKIYVE